VLPSKPHSTPPLNPTTQVLDYLDASNNRLGGRLDELTLPASLEFADLSGNAIGGQLWGSMAGLTNLEELRVARNAIAGGFLRL
jgi:hypothetical protein